jgi:CubicO group peptidase (beta-lactamase class C family)
MRLVCALMLSCLVFNTSPASAAPDPVDQYLRREMERAHIPATAVAVLRDGKLIKLAVYGQADLEQGTPVTLHSPFQIASSTKLLTSALLMQLVGEGKLDLDAPVSHYIENAPPAWSTMTLRHLASHTSGLPRAAFPPELADPAQAVEMARKQTLAARPGERVAYGSLDFSLLAYILERAGGMPFEQLLAQRITGPLAMTDTRFARFELSPGRDMVKTEMVAGRVNTYEWSNGRQMAYRYLYPAYTFAAGGAFASIRDVANFLQAIDGDNLLVPALKERMWEPVKLANGQESGFSAGWTRAEYRGQREVGHSGGPALADIRYYPGQRLAVAVLASQRTMAPVLARGVAALYLPAPAFLAEQGIADADLAKSALVRRVLEQLAAGNADPALFAGPAHESLKDLNALTPLQLGALPPLSRLVLLETSADNNVRTYRAIHGKTDSVGWVVSFNGDGKIVDIDTFDE